MYAETRRNILQGDDIDHEIAILRDGFTDFQLKYRVSICLLPFGRGNWSHLEWPRPRRELG